MNKSRRPELVPGTRELAAQFGAKLPAATSRTVVAMMDGRPVGIAGLYMEQAHLILWAEISTELRQFRRFLLEAGRALLAQVAHLHLPVYSAAQADVPGSAVLLEHLGFEHVFDNVFGRLS